MRGKLFLTLTVATGMFLTTNAFAAKQDISINKNFDTGRIIISGESEENDTVTIQILPEGLGLGEFAVADNQESVVVYTDDYECGDDGKYEFNIKVTKTGKYTAYICGEKTDIISNEIGYFANKEDYEKAIESVNEDFTGNLEENLENLGFSDVLNEKINISDVAELMKNELGEGKKLVASEFDDNIKLYKECMVIVLLNEEKIDNVADYTDGILEEDSTLREYWDKHANTEEKQEYLTEHMSGRNISDLKDFKEVLTEALILTAVKYPDGYMNIKEIFKEYKDILDLSSVSTKDSVYKKLAEKGEFSGISELIEEYEDLISEKESSGGTGGSGGSGGNRVANSGAVSSVTVPSTGALKPELSLKFTDLGSVLWAYPSISVLYEEGIINGVSETEFKPENLVTREQFVKMLVLAMGLEISNESAGFSDVSENMWYAEFINTAYNNKIVNGFSATEFGVGQNITRQDMAVMIYNAMVKCGFSGTENETVFSDMNDVSDYAKSAVSKLSKAGIINGVGDNLFAPKNTATRAEAAVIVERALKYFR